MKLKQLYPLLTQRGLWYCADKPTVLKFDFGIANRWQRKKASEIRGDLMSFYF